MNWIIRSLHVVQTEAKISDQRQNFFGQNRTLVGHWLGRVHRRQALYALVPILMFLELVLPTEFFEPCNNPDQSVISGG